MMTLIFGDLVYNKLGPPLISQQVRDFRIEWLWCMITSINMPKPHTCIQYKVIAQNMANIVIPILYGLLSFHIIIGFIFMLLFIVNEYWCGAI